MNVELHFKKNRIQSKIMFRSSSFHKIDPKGRVIIPARFKTVIVTDGGNELMITINAGCLYAYTMKKWTEIEKKTHGRQTGLYDPL